MIAAATKDARNAALQFTTDSGSQVGSISDASQGVFQIFASGSDEDDPTAINGNGTRSHHRNLCVAGLTTFLRLGH